MKAIQIKQTGGPEVMELVDLPVPQPKPNEAVVKIAAAGVNFIDVYNREGRYKTALPFVLGQEGAGTVTSVGADVREVAVGDRVAYVSVLGSYAEYAAVPADRLVKIPAGVSERDAAAESMPITRPLRRRYSRRCRAVAPTGPREAAWVAAAGSSPTAAPDPGRDRAVIQAP